MDRVARQLVPEPTDGTLHANAWLSYFRHVVAPSVGREAMTMTMPRTAEQAVGIARQIFLVTLRTGIGVMVVLCSVDIDRRVMELGIEGAVPM